MSSDFELRVIRARARVLAKNDRSMKRELVELRREAGLTQQDVANTMGCTQQAVQKLERYDADPKLSTLRRYVNAIGALVSHEVRRDDTTSLVTAYDENSQRASVTSLTTFRHRAPAQIPNDVTWAVSKRTDFALSA